MAIPGGFIAGDVLGAADMNLLPAGKVGYAAVTADQASITTTVDLTSLTVTWTAVSARRYRITAFCTMLCPSNPAGKTMASVSITDGSNTVKQIGYGNYVPASTTWSHLYSSVFVAVTETGLSGSTTRKLRGTAVDSGNEGTTVSLAASATNPSYILVEDIGPA